MFEVGGVQKIGSFSTMGEKTEKAETQRTVQEMELLESGHLNNVNDEGKLKVS